VYLVATLYVVLYENNIVDKRLSQYVLLSITNLVNKVPSTLLIDLKVATPLRIIGCRTHMFPQKMICQMFNSIINEMNPLICD